MLAPAFSVTQQMMWGRDVVDFFISVPPYRKLCQKSGRFPVHKIFCFFTSHRNGWNSSRESSNVLCLSWSQVLAELLVFAQLQEIFADLYRSSRPHLLDYRSPMLRETRPFQHLLSPPSLLLSSLAGNRHFAAAACLHLPTLLWHSQAHRFWERTWKRTWKGTSQRTCSRALQRSWLRICKNFYLNIYTTWQRKLMHLMRLKFQSRFYQISSYDKACKKSWASCGWEKVSRKKSLGTCGKKVVKTAKSRCWGKNGARKPKWRS